MQHQPRMTESILNLLLNSLGSCKESEFGFIVQSKQGEDIASIYEMPIFEVLEEVATIPETPTIILCSVPEGYNNFLNILTSEQLFDFLVMLKQTGSLHIIVCFSKLNKESRITIRKEFEELKKAYPYLNLDINLGESVEMQIARIISELKSDSSKQEG